MSDETAVLTIPDPAATTAKPSTVPVPTPEELRLQALQAEMAKVQPEVAAQFQNWLEGHVAQAKAHGYVFARLDYDDRGWVAHLSKLEIRATPQPGVITKYGRTALEACMLAYQRLMELVPKPAAPGIQDPSEPPGQGRNQGVQG